MRPLSEWFQVYKNEAALFLWIAVVYFLIRSSNILFSNFAETTFLKRFDVAYLPAVYMVNALFTFFSISLVGGLQRKISANRLLAWILLFCGISIAGSRFLIRMNLSLMYPVLFLLKGQYETLLGLQFWSLANDLFNARQSKRIFPLITAAGIVGGILGSFITPLLADIIHVDNLLLFYMFPTAAGAVLAAAMEKQFPSRIFNEESQMEPGAQRSVINAFKQIPELVKGSRLIKFLILLHLLPNVVIPVINFQFRYVIDQSYATEGGVLDFFGYFMGCLNSMNLIMLLFAGRIFKRWGLPTALMFHPVNYLLAFFGLLVRFDIFTAMYARLSTGILRTAFNKPARASLFGLLPKQDRDIIRSFLRGGVARIGIIAGAGLVLLSEGFMDPRYLSILAFFFVGGWIVATYILRRRYPGLVLSLISRSDADPAAMKDLNAGDLFHGKAVQKRLLHHFLTAKGRECLWYARLLRSSGAGGLDSHILDVIKRQDDQTAIGLLSLLSTQAGHETLQVLKDMLDSSTPELMVAIARAGNRFSADTARELNLEILKQAQTPLAQAYAVAGRYGSEPEKYGERINTWLNAEENSHKTAGVIAAGRSGDGSYISRLKEYLSTESNPSLLIHALEGIQRLAPGSVSREFIHLLYHPVDVVRQKALEIFEISGDDDLKRAIDLLRDPSDPVNQEVQNKIISAPHQNSHLLIASLNLPSRRIRKGVLQILDSIGMTDLDLRAFIHIQLTRGYTRLAAADALNALPPCPERDMLIKHLEQERRLEMTNLLRIMAAKDRSGKMRIIWRGIASRDARRRSNSLEALEQFLDPSLSTMISPLIEATPPAEALKAGREYMEIPCFEQDRQTLFNHLLTDPDWVTVVLCLNLACRVYPDEVDPALVQQLMETGDEPIRETAESLMTSGASPFMKKIFHLQKVRLFSGLAVSELALVARCARQIDQPADTVLVQEGASGDALYGVVKGKVAVRRPLPGDAGAEEMGQGRFFGETALIDAGPYRASVKTLEDAQFLVLYRQEFMEMAKECPEILLHIAEVLSSRLQMARHSHCRKGNNKRRKTPAYLPVK